MELIVRKRDRKRVIHDIHKRIEIDENVNVVEPAVIVLE